MRSSLSVFLIFFLSLSAVSFTAKGQGSSTLEIMSADLLEGDGIAESIIAYIRLLWNPHDDRAFFRAADTSGGPGRAVVSNLLKVSVEKGTTLWDTAMAGSTSGIEKGQAAMLENWCGELEELKSSLPAIEFTSLLTSLLKRLEQESNRVDLDEHEPWQHLVNLSVQYEGMSAFKAIPRFLTYLTVQNPSERIGPRTHSITLLTLHAAKGLEYPVVFIVGAEDDLIPFSKHGGQPDVEEERRLFYMGMTRARERLYITYCRNRFMFGKRISRKPSPFIGEISDKWIDFQTPEPVRKSRKNKQLSMW